MSFQFKEMAAAVGMSTRLRRSSVRCRAGKTTNSAAGVLRLRLRKSAETSTPLAAPCCHDGLSARLIAQSGLFDVAFVSGFSVAAGRLAKPDVGLLSFGEVMDQSRSIIEAAGDLPIIVDADTGYGNGVNCHRTVSLYAKLGFAGILIEDQEWPKSCGHVGPKRVVNKDEAVARIRAACDARDEVAAMTGQDPIMVFARSDARQAVGLSEALERAQCFADAGADALFVDALESEEEMSALCSVAPAIPKMANNLEGGGKTPLLPRGRLGELGYSIVAYPLSLLGVSIKAMQSALDELAEDRIPDSIPTLGEIRDVVEWPQYDALAAKYSSSKD